MEQENDAKRTKTADGPQFTLLHTLSGHSAPVTSARYSPNGAYIATSSDDGLIKIWETETGQLKTTLEGHERGISDVSWIRDSKHLGSVSDDKTVRVWNVVDGKEIRRMKGHTHHITSICFNHKGNLLATGSSDENVLIWDTLRGRLMKTLAAHADPVSAVAFSHDSTVLSSASFDGLIRIWDSGSGHCLKTLVSPERSPVMAARFSPNGRYLLSSTLDGTIRLWDILDLSENNKCVKTYNAAGETFKYSCSAGFVSKGDRTYIVQGMGEDGYFGVWDVQTKRMVDKFRAHDTGAILCVDDFIEKSQLATSGADGTIKLWNVS